MPMTSLGSRSGVNWMRPKRTSRQAASERTSSVLPMPGTPSMRLWAEHSSVMKPRRSGPSCPTSTAASVSRRRS